MRKKIRGLRIDGAEKLVEIKAELAGPVLTVGGDLNQKQLLPESFLYWKKEEELLQTQH